MATRFLDIFGLEHYHNLIDSIFKKKDDFVVIDIQYPSMQHNERAQKVVEISSYLPTSAYNNTDNYAVISIALEEEAHHWSYWNAYRSDETIPEISIYPKVKIIPNGTEVYLYTEIINIFNEGDAPKLRVVLARIS